MYDFPLNYYNCLNFLLSFEIQKGRKIKANDATYMNMSVTQIKTLTQQSMRQLQKHKDPTACQPVIIRLFSTCLHPLCSLQYFCIQFKVVLKSLLKRGVCPTFLLLAFVFLLIKKDDLA